jgi:hypothetical protein
VYQLKGDRKKALELYRKYLAADPKGEGAPEAQVEAQVLEREIKADEALQAAEEAKRRLEAEAQRLREEEQQRKKLAGAQQSSASVAEESAGRRKLLFGLAGAAAGLALGGVVLMVVELLRHDQPVCDDGRPADQCPFKRDATIGIVLGAVGAAVFAGTSAALFLIGRRSGAPASAPVSGGAFWIAPFTDGRQVGVGLGGRF